MIQARPTMLGVLGVAGAGLSLLVAGTENRISKRVALQWVAVGIGIGEVAGLAADNMLLGVGGGAAVGTWIAALRRDAQLHAGEEVP